MCDKREFRQSVCLPMLISFAKVILYCYHAYFIYIRPTSMSLTTIKILTVPDDDPIGPNEFGLIVKTDEFDALK